MLVENKFLRILVVFGNNVISLIGVPVGIIKLIVTYIREKDMYNDLDLYWTDMWDVYIRGLDRAIQANRDFLKTGDLENFDIDQLATEVAEEYIEEMEDELD